MNLRLFLFLLFLAVLPACRVVDPLPADPASAKEHIVAWVKAGSSIADAETQMKKRGFECSRDVNPKSHREYLVCTNYGAGLLVKREWLIRFEIENGRVKEPEVFTDMLGP